MDTKVISVYKPVGVTPLQMIKKVVEQIPHLSKSKLGYAGRLDPMAEGVLLILVGEENKKRKLYERMEKEYIFEMIFGISTDSYDILGKITSENLKSLDKNLKENFLSKIPLYIGKHMQQYPPYSAVRIQGKPLFYWARENRLSEIHIPQKEIEIYDFHLLKLYEKTKDDLYGYIRSSIQKVNGEFRQKEILEIWEKEYSEFPQTFIIAQCKITCSSGTYIRGIINMMGKDLGIGTIALTIKRTKVGAFD